MGDQAGEREALFPTALEDLLEQSQPPVLIEIPFLHIRISPVPQLELSGFLCSGHTAPGPPQPPQMFRAQRGIDDVEGPFATLESILDERKHHPILLVSAVEEGAHVTLCAQH